MKINKELQKNLEKQAEMDGLEIEMKTQNSRLKSQIKEMSRKAETMQDHLAQQENVINTREIEGGSTYIIGSDGRNTWSI